jgi:hypothetical protein
VSIAVTRIVLWWLMLALALGVAGYASMALWHPDGIDFVARRSGWLRLALIVHGLSGALALMLGPFQFLADWRRRWPRVHRWSGRVYLACILISGLTGLWLAFHTPGGVAAQSGFFVLAVLWLLTGSLALRAVLRRDFTAHRAWMMRSYALTFGAVTLRIYLGLGVPLAGLPFNEVYAMAAWASWVINLLVVEWLLLRHRSAEALTR